MLGSYLLRLRHPSTDWGAMFTTVVRRSRREGLNMALVLLNMSTPLLSDRDIGEVCI